MTIDWQISRFDELTPRALYALLQARQDVFVLEQQCLFQDLDDADEKALHLLGSVEGKLVAYLRIFAPGVKHAEVCIGRVLTTRDVRRTGAGRLLMAEGLRHVEERFPGQRVRIGAQQYLEAFYASFGFATVSAPYDEDGIPHVEMLR